MNSNKLATFYIVTNSCEIVLVKKTSALKTDKHLQSSAIIQLQFMFFQHGTQYVWRVTGESS